MTAIIIALLTRYGAYLAVVVGVGSAALVWDRSRVAKGVEKERARVEDTGNKIDAKAQSARRAVTSRPSDKRLDGMWRD